MVWCEATLRSKGAARHTPLRSLIRRCNKLESRAKKANDFQLRSTNSGDEQQLTGVTFGGSDKDVVITVSGASTTGSN